MCHKIAKKIIIWCEKDQEFDGYEHIKAVYGIEVFLESFWKLAGLLLLGCLAENRQMFFVSILYILGIQKEMEDLFQLTLDYFATV